MIWQGGQIDLDGLTHIGDAGVAVAVLITVIVVVVVGGWVLRDYIRSRREAAEFAHQLELARIDASKERHAVQLAAEDRREKERLDVERAQTDVLKDLREELKRSQRQREADRTIWESLTATVANLVKAVNNLNVQLEEAEERMAKVTTERKRRLDDLEDRIKNVPADLEARLEPRLVALHAVIEQQFEELAHTLVRQVTQAGVSPALREMLEQTVNGKVQAILDGIDELSDLITRIETGQTEEEHHVTD